jgi:hypothetical protein
MNDPSNENAPAWDRGARQNFPSRSNAQPPESGKPQEKHWEDRANWASCFPPRNPKSEHPPNFTGITVVDGKKYWVNCYEKLDRNGNRYVSVNIRPFSAERA